jgi:glycosyltransferase involved in cell wall biosynthesis
MKILHTVEQYFPSVGGMQEVARQISERLVGFGHEVTVATSYRADRNFKDWHGVSVEAFKISGNAVRGYEEATGERKRYRDFLVNSDFDVITNFAAQQWATDLAWESFPEIKAKKIFVPTGFSGLYDPLYKDYFSKMADVMKEYDLNIFLSHDYRDINFARDHGIQKFEVIPNGASAEEFLKKNDYDFRPRRGLNKGTFFILLVGSHTGEKGHHEAMEIFSKANLANSTLVIIANVYSLACYGECFFRSLIHNLFHSNKILIRSLSREETVAAYHQADLFLFPSNIECSPLVLFEAMASKIPFLTTDVGNAKEIIEWSQGGVLLPTEKDQTGYSHAKIEESAILLKDLYNNRDLRESLGRNGYEAWRDKFTWEKIARNYERQYKRALENI